MSKIIITSKPCPACGEIAKVEVERTDYDKYLNGALIQKAFPYLDADTRERFISGFCPSCWEKMIGSDV